MIGRLCRFIPSSLSLSSLRHVRIDLGGSCHSRTFRILVNVVNVLYKCQSHDSSSCVSHCLICITLRRSLPCGNTDREQPQPRGFSHNQQSSQPRSGLRAPYQHLSTFSLETTPRRPRRCAQCNICGRDASNFRQLCIHRSCGPLRRLKLLPGILDVSLPRLSWAVRIQLPCSD